jgi:hypothetical protein
MVIAVLIFLCALLLLSEIRASMGEEIDAKHCDDITTNVAHTGMTAVMLTVGKDKSTFEYSIQSALEHLKDVENYYVITPNCEELVSEFGLQYGGRVKFVGESMFPFTIKDMHVLPQPNKGWYLQQLLKVMFPDSCEIPYSVIFLDLRWTSFQPHIICHTRFRHYMVQ